MHGNPQSAQVAYSEHTADNITAKVVKNEHFPDGLAVGGQEGRSRSGGAVGVRVIVILLVDGIVEVEDLLERGDLAVAQGDRLGSHVRHGWDSPGWTATITAWCERSIAEFCDSCSIRCAEAFLVLVYVVCARSRATDL